MRTWPRVFFMVALALASRGVSGLAQAPGNDGNPGREGPLSPKDAAAAFLVEPALRVDLVASEPLIASPVAMAFDERGRLYVAENRGYPTGPGPNEGPLGRVALLEDRDRDGRMDHRSEFAEGLTYPNGVMPWKGGLIVTCAPDVLYLKDTDGDGKADERKVLFTGFDTTGSTQLRASHPTLSIDNWVYVTSGLKGGKITSPDAPDRPPVVLNRTDFRFRPGGDAWEATDGGAQFGLSFDDFGRRFICYNRVQVQHVVISSRTLRRNPSLAFSATVENCPVETVPEPLKGHGAAAKLYPISRNVTTADSHAGTFTAACAVFVYRGAGLPRPYLGDVLSCDPTANLVHVDRLEPRGATFAARRATYQSEFLASSDNWFRPVFLAGGPDGALYVCDMYRKTIEHPEYLPVEIRKRTDFESGKTMGRIWRVSSKALDPALLDSARRIDFSRASTRMLCTGLRINDGWWRDTAHRLLLERKDPESIGPLELLAADPQSPPATVVHALRLLEAQGALTDLQVGMALKHGSPAVREHALQLVEARISDDNAWMDDVLPLANDVVARVRFQAAITLGAFPNRGEQDRARVAALVRIACQDGPDRWLRAAVLSSIAKREPQFLAALRDRPADAPAPVADLLRELGRLLGTSRPPDAWPELVRTIAGSGSGRFSPEEQAALLTGLCESARGRPGPRTSQSVLAAIVADEPNLGKSISELVRAMGDVAADPDRPVAQRGTAIGLLAFADHDQAGEALLKLLDRQQPPEVQAAAVRALGHQRDDRVAGALLDRQRFAAYTPALREEVLSALVGQSHHLPGLLDALEAGTIPPGMIDALRRRQLTQNRDPEIRRRALALFGAVSGDRAKVYDAYKDVATQKGDPAKGLAVFKRECASCHRLDREGFAVGPDLFGIRNQPREAILLHILVPDHEITQGFASYTVATTDGRVLTGLVASESPTSLTLRQPLGKEDTILRSEIEELSVGKQSLMPQGVEKNISRQEFADLLGYLKGE